MIFSHWLVITWLFSFPTCWSFPTLIDIFILLSIVMKYETSLVMWLLLPLSTNHVSSSTVDDVSSSTALNKMWPSSSESFYVSSLLRSALSVFLSLQFFARCPGLCWFVTHKTPSLIIYNLLWKGSLALHFLQPTLTFIVIALFANTIPFIGLHVMIIFTFFFFLLKQTFPRRTLLPLIVFLAILHASHVLSMYLLAL